MFVDAPVIGSNARLGDFQAVLQFRVNGYSLPPKQAAARTPLKSPDGRPTHAEQMKSRAKPTAPHTDQKDFQQINKQYIKALQRNKSEERLEEQK